MPGKSWAFPGTTRAPRWKVKMPYWFEDCSLDLDRQELLRNGARVAVEPGVLDLLGYLIANRARVVSKDELIAQVWGGRIVSESTLSSRIAIVRQVIGDDGERQRLIRTISRKGFRFVGDVRESAAGHGAELAAAPAGAAPATTPPPMTVLVVDDHALIREALRAVLLGLGRAVTVVEAANAAQAMRTIAEDPGIALVLLDLKLPDRDGFEVLAELRERHASTAVVVLSASEARDDMARALDLGALGFIPKSASGEVMRSAFNLILAGGVYVPPEILGPRPSQPQDRTNRKT
jgi:DNA-binding response OmpR family regulator